MWTGGQYSLYRSIFGLYLLQHFALLLPWGSELFSHQGVLPDKAVSPFLKLFPNVFLLSDAPWFVSLCIGSGVLASIFFAIGKFDRIAALLLWYLLAILFGRNPLISNPSLPFVGWLLLAHLCLPTAPYGSWTARDRVDPGNNWTFPRELFLAAWILMSLGYSYSGYTKLISPSWVDGTALGMVIANPLARSGFLQDLFLSLPPILLALATWAGLGLELLFAPLALFRRIRPFIWLAMVLMHLTLIALIDFADLSFGMVMLHFFTFDPKWVPRRFGERSDLLYYDGACGLCHRAIRFLMAEDTQAGFQFAPLGGAEFKARTSEAQRLALPDSLVVQTETGELLVESDAVLYILQRLGGAWGVLGAVGRYIPKAVRDLCYRSVAKIRHMLFAKPSDVCPLMPGHLQDRFLKA